MREVHPSGVSGKPPMESAGQAMEQLEQHPFHAAALETLSASLQCYYLGRLSLVEPCSGAPTFQPLDMHQVVTAMGHSPPAQATAGACLAQLCRIEADLRADEPDTRLSYSHCQKARSQGTFGLVMDGIMEAVGVRPVARCVLPGCRVVVETTPACMPRGMSNGCRDVFAGPSGPLLCTMYFANHAACQLHSVFWTAVSWAYQLVFGQPCL